MSDFWKDKPESPLLVELFGSRRNALVVAGIVITVFLVLGVVAKILALRYAIVIAALAVLGGITAYDRSERRRWESALQKEIETVRQDHSRLVREVARGRNETAQLRQGLSEAGSLARVHKGQGAAAEARMLQAVIDRLSSLGEATRWAANDTPEFEDDELDEAVSSAPGGTSLETLLANNISDDLLLKLVRHALKHDRIEMFAQPIVALPQRKLRFYEMFSRIQARAGVYVPAGRYITLARQQDLAPAIDNLLLLRCLQHVRDEAPAQSDSVYFCNIAQNTLFDANFMGDLVEFISHNRDVASRLVFELAQEDFSGIDTAVLPVLDGLASLGCRFSMDRVTSLSFDMTLLKARHVRFLKIEARQMLRQLGKQGGLARMQLLKSQLDRNGIDLIVEKIESERELRELLDVRIDFGQGYLFGQPELAGKAA